MTKKLKNFVGGEFVDTQNGSVSELVNPSTGEVFATAPISGAADMDRAYGVAAKAFESWKNSTPSERQQALLTIADTFEAHAQELVDIESENTGKPIPVTMVEELPPMIDQINFLQVQPESLRARLRVNICPDSPQWCGGSRKG
jgi:betaine-aldehyde dehydrogenase